MHTETERKFLVLNAHFKAQAVASHRIKQGYLARDSGNSVRVRILDDKGILTIKGPSADEISRSEWEIEIPLQDAENLLRLCHGGIIDKTRYIVPEGCVPSGTLSFASSLPQFEVGSAPLLSPCGSRPISPQDKPSDPASAVRSDERKEPRTTPPSGKYFEVDVFYGDNEGLVMAEIELDSPDQPFTKPEWLGQEVTGNRHYYNSYLSLHPFKQW